MKYILLIFSFFFFFSCKESQDHVDHSKMDHHHHHEAMKMGEISNQSVYNLNGKWTESSGSSIELSSFRGKFVLVAMIYGTCKDVCPILVENMKQIEGKLGAKSESIQFVLISFDPEKDSPAALKTYKEKANINRANWHLLTGLDADIKELAAVLGVKYKKEANGSFSHSNSITLLNKEGEIETTLEGLNKDSSGIIEKIK